MNTHSSENDEKVKSTPQLGSGPQLQSPLREPGTMRSCGTSPQVCSNSNCGMSIFLVNQLVVDDKTRKQMTKSELNARVTYSGLWK